MDWAVVSFVMSSKPRFKVLIELFQGKSTPSKLADALGFPSSHVSKALSELSEKGLVRCLTPERRKTKFYEITEEGTKCIAEINKMTSKQG